MLLIKRGDSAAGSRLLSAALKALPEGARIAEGHPELLRRKGELLLLFRAPASDAGAERYFRRALDVARHQDALSWELRTATSLARLWHGQRRTTQAHDGLSPVYQRFTEGFETADLIVARSLLASLR